MDTGLSIILFLLYLGLFALYIYLIVLFVRMSNDVKEMRTILKDISFRDTARYITDVEDGRVSQEAQRQAEKTFEA